MSRTWKDEPYRIRALKSKDRVASHSYTCEYSNFTRYKRLKNELHIEGYYWVIELMGISPSRWRTSPIFFKAYVKNLEDIDNPDKWIYSRAQQVEAPYYPTLIIDNYILSRTDKGCNYIFVNMDIIANYYYERSEPTPCDVDDPRHGGRCNYYVPTDRYNRGHSMDTKTYVYGPMRAYERHALNDARNYYNNNPIHDEDDYDVYIPASRNGSTYAGSYWD